MLVFNINNNPIKLVIIGFKAVFSAHVLLLRTAVILVDQKKCYLLFVTSRVTSNFVALTLASVMLAQILFSSTRLKCKVGALRGLSSAFI